LALYQWFSLPPCGNEGNYELPYEYANVI